jgi:predicted nucleic acid-binding Zn ribbon protein
MIKKPSSLSEILQDQLNRLSQGRFANTISLQRLWPQFVGPKIASHSKILTVKNGEALIGVDHSAWLGELNLMKTEILAKIQSSAHECGVTALRFKIHS